MTNWRERDQKHLWHPLTQHQLHAEHLPISKAEGCYLIDENGKQYLDGIASWYTCMYGHCNPYLIRKIQEGMQQLDQVVFSGFTHPPAIELSEKLIEILPKGQEKLFFSDNGSTSVDVALKMAFQYHFNQGKKCHKIIAFEDGFHGDTFGAMSVSGLSVYNGPFEDFFLEVERIPTPERDDSENYLDQFESLVKQKDVAAFVYEPLVQGAAGMKMYDAQLLNSMLQLCADHKILSIADEVMTGFGKTGKYFASEYLENKPDIICLSKSLTGGMVPMGITSCNQKVYHAFLSDSIHKGFFHGHTYSANPLACNAASACIDLLTSSEYQNHIKRISRKQSEFVKLLERESKVKNARSLGVIMALELNVQTDRYGSLRDQFFQFFMEEGVFLRPLGETIYVLAPFTISDEQLDIIHAKILDSLKLI